MRQAGDGVPSYDELVAVVGFLKQRLELLETGVVELEAENAELRAENVELKGGGNRVRQKRAFVDSFCWSALFDAGLNAGG